jgi:4-amino-4-deoxychorismate lyase
MYLYFETIRIDGGEARNLSFHQARFEKTREECLGMAHHPRLEKFIQVPPLHETGLVRCRITFGREITGIEYLPYERRAIGSLKIVSSDSVSYPYKYSDRSKLEALYALRGRCEDILIVRKGLITDSFIANVVLWNGYEWLTPVSPLLQGTMRASLLASGKVRTEEITLEKLPSYEKIRLINAFNNLEEAPELGTDALVY